jgi:hypothetical protein
VDSSLHSESSVKVVNVQALGEASNPPERLRTVAFQNAKSLHFFCVTLWDIMVFPDLDFSIFRLPQLTS